MVQEVMICDVDIMYFYNSIINHTLSDPQWRASRADMWVRHDHSPWVTTSRSRPFMTHEKHSTQTTPTNGPVRAYQGPWAARSSVVNRWAGCRASTLLLVTPWPLRAALGPRQEATHYSISKKRLVAASRKPRRAGHEPWRSTGWLGTSLHAR